MKIQYRHQKFQADAARAVVDVFAGQRILEQMNKIQRANQLKPSDRLEGREGGYNLTIEMETGVGKTYTYIKTMFELNKYYEDKANGEFKIACFQDLFSGGNWGNGCNPIQRRTVFWCVLCERRIR